MTERFCSGAFILLHLPDGPLLDQVVAAFQNQYQKRGITFNPQPVAEGYADLKFSFTGEGFPPGALYFTAGSLGDVTIQAMTDLELEERLFAARFIVPPKMELMDAGAIKTLELVAIPR